MVKAVDRLIDLASFGKTIVTQPNSAYWFASIIHGKKKRTKISEIDDGIYFYVRDVCQEK